MLEELKASGKIRHYGVSNYTVPMMRECQRSGKLTANQVGYNLFDRRMESKVLPYCLERQVGFMAYGTLGFGLLTGAFRPETTFVEWDWRSHGKSFGLPLFEHESFLKEIAVVELLRELARRSGHTVAQLAIAWVLGNPAVSVALCGFRRPAEVTENVAAVDWKLTAGERAEIDQVFADENVPTYVDAEQAV